ncbi:MAG TPA: TetR/AcrR family transcriptional regulator [Ktedonobacterales bacterium]
MASGQDKERADGTSRPYHHGDLRAALIAAGLAILAEEGARGLTVRAAARRAGVSHNAPYRHFADKTALLAAIAQEGFEELAGDLERARVAAGPSPMAQMEETGWAYVRYASAHPDHLRVMFGGDIPDSAAYPQLARAGAQAFAVLVAALRAGQEQGLFIAGDPRQLALTPWALVHGLSLLLIDHQLPIAGGEEERERLIRQCLRQSVEGLTRRA